LLHFIVVHHKPITNILDERADVFKTCLFVCPDGLDIIFIYREHNLPQSLFLRKCFSELNGLLTCGHEREDGGGEYRSLRETATAANKKGGRKAAFDLFSQ
jgi:hypothetical protein